jgi:DNA integrity scanning protein DisA with diadenylate cyclase activity
MRKEVASMKLTFNKYYFAIATLLFITEVLIALFAANTFVRSYFGDVLVVILIYCFVKSFIKMPVLPLAIGVLSFAFTIEFLQYLKIVEILGLQKSALARTVIGTSFAWLDILSYVVGIVFVLVVEKLKKVT